MKTDPTPGDIIAGVTARLDGVVPRASWGETALFYNPGNRLAHGVYFCTLKEKDGDNDRSSNLAREGVYRLSIGIPTATYENRFGARPRRPAKGGVVDTGHDFTLTNVLMPHPIYAWMSWVCVLSPTRALFDEIYPLIVEAHARAAARFAEKVKKLPPNGYS